MNWKFFFSLLGVITLFAVQLALVKTLPGGDYFYLSLTVLVFIVVLFGLDTALFWWLSIGFLTDLFSFNFFGFYTLLMLVVLLLINFLYNSVLTNRSLYAFLLLTVAATLLYDLSSYLAFSLPWQNFVGQEIKRLGANLLLTIIIFYGITLLSHRLRPVFLIRSKS